MSVLTKMPEFAPRELAVRQRDGFAATADLPEAPPGAPG